MNQIKPVEWEEGMHVQNPTRLSLFFYLNV